jgi:hypothetical protein
LRLGGSAHSEIVSTARRHGQDLQRQGCAVSRVVYDYGDLCQAMTELAGQHSIPISATDFEALNRCLDEAIAGAVSEFGYRLQEPVRTLCSPGLPSWTPCLPTCAT